MSRIGKRILEVPENVNVTLSGNTITIKGPLGELSKTFPDNVAIKFEDNKITVSRKNEAKFSKQMHGTTNSLISSMLLGVTKGFKKELKIVGVGYRASMQGNSITVNAGYSHPITLEIPQDIKIELPKPIQIVVSGINKESVGEFAANIRKIRKPNVYSGKGIMYVDEHIMRKEGKTAGK